MKKSTFVRSLLLCGLSMLLCLSMLAGSTFAWFTDEVKSGNNTIMAGNLDVELYNALANEIADSNKVSASTALFDDVALWEPGVVAYENLTVTNEGDLALKYQLKVNIENAKGAKNLADVLKVAVVENGITANDRTALINSINADAWMDFESFVESGKLFPAGSTEASTATYGIVIWWKPSDIDNDYNMNNGKGGALSVDIGVNLYATQVEAEDENDSFGNDYDADAWMDAMEIFSASDLQAAINNGATQLILKDDIVTDKPIEIPVAPTTYSLRNATPAVVIDLNGKTISMSEDKLTTTYAIVNLGNLVLMDSVGGGSVNSRGIYNGYVAETGEIVPSANLTVVNGVYNALGTDGGAAIFNYGSVTIESGTFTSVGGYTLNNREGASMIIEDATVTGGIFNASTLVIEDGNISTNRGGYTHAIYSSGGSIEINGGNFSGNGNEVINANSDVAIINGGTFEKVGKTSYLLAGSKMVINAGTFNAYSENGVNPAAHPVRPDVTVNGGSFNYKHNNIAAGYTAVENADGSYTVLPGVNTELVENGLYKDGNTYYVTNADGMLALSTKSATYFSGKTIKLANDIDCTDVAMKKIYIWDSENPTTFDGCGYTIYNLDISTASNSGNQGLIHGTVNVKNLTVDGAWVQGNGYVGVIAGTLYGNIENCHVKNAQVFAGYWQAGIMVGQFNGTSIKDCSVVDSEIYAPSAVAAIAGIFTDNNNPDIKFENCVVKNCAINQTYSFGADYDVLFGAILGCGNVDGKNYIFNNCVVENTTIRGEASDILCGEASQIWIDGEKYVAVSNITE